MTNNINSCRQERTYHYNCGPEGKYWVQRPPTLWERLRKAPQSLVQSVYKVFGSWIAKFTDSRVRASMTEETLMEFSLVILSHCQLLFLAFIVFVANPPIILYVFFLLAFIIIIVVNMITSYIFLKGLEQ